MFYLNSKVYILMKNNVIRQIFLITSCQLSLSKQIMQMLKLQPFIFPCCAVMPHLFIAFVFPSSNTVGIGFQTLDRITDHTNKFYKQKLNGDNNPLTINNFTQTIQIYDADINIAVNMERQGIRKCPCISRTCR